MTADGTSSSQTKTWQRIVLTGFSFGVGIALTASLIFAGFLWYESRPKSPEPSRPWNTKAITAEFDVLDTEGDKNNIIFNYTLQNNTEFDYQMPEGSVRLMAQLQRENSLSSADEGFTNLDKNVFIPAKQRFRYTVHMGYPYDKETLPSNASREQKTAWRQRLASYLNQEMGNLNGFVLFDESNRYQINLPKGW
jgi:hypothetical protein